MLKKALALSILLPLSTVSIADEGMIRIKSQHSVAQTTDKLINVLTAKGMTVFNTIEHSKGAQKVGIDIAQTKVVIFGNPKVGSPLMKCAPTVAIDLPQKALIQEDENNVVWISYNNPQYLKKRHNIVGCDAVLNKVSKALSNFATAAAS